MNSGHYTTGLNMEGRWLICDDAKSLKVSSSDPVNGYLFLYEKTPLKVPEAMPTSSRGEEICQGASSTSSQIKPTPFTSRNTKKTQKGAAVEGNISKDCKQNRAPVDISPDSVEVSHLSKSEVIEKLALSKVQYKQKQTLERNKSV